MKTYFTFMKESHTPYPLYHKSYTDAINAALAHHKDLNVSDEDRDTHIAMGPRKPAEGETVKHRIPATDKNGDKHMIDVQVYNKGGNKPFELNTYSSKVSKKKVAEETVNVSEGLGDVRPRAVETNDPIGKFSELKTYAEKLGPKHIDYHDLMVAASHMAFGNENHLAKHVKALDTDVRDKVKEYLSPEFKKRHLEEEVEQIDEQVSFKKTESGDHHIHHNGERVGKIIKTNSMGSLGYSVRIGDDEVSSERSLDAAKESAKYHLTSSESPLKEQEELDEMGKKGPYRPISPGTQNLRTAQAATKGDRALDKQYGYGTTKGGVSPIAGKRREQGFGAVANFNSAAAALRAKRMGEPPKTQDAEVHKGWGKTVDQMPAANPEKQAARKKLQQTPFYALSKGEKEKDTVLRKGITKEEVEPLAEISAALAMRASRAATKEVGMGKSDREDKLIGLQKTADEKFRKMLGRSSSAKVATTPEE